MWYTEKISTMFGLKWIVRTQEMILHSRGDGGSGGALHFTYESQAERVAETLNEGPYPVSPYS